MAKRVDPRISRKDLKLYELLDHHTNKKKRNFQVEGLEIVDFFKHHYGMANYYWTGSWMYDHEDRKYIQKNYPDVAPIATKFEEALANLEKATGMFNYARRDYVEALKAKLYNPVICQSDRPTFISEEEEEAFAKKQQEEIAQNLATQAEAKKLKDNQNG